MFKISPLWAALGIGFILLGLLGAAFQSGKTYAEKKIIAKEHAALIKYVEEHRRIAEGYRKIYESIAASTDESPIGGVIAGTLSDIKRVQRKP